MPSTRGGQHGNLCYTFEDAGFNQSPNDTTFKPFGSNARMETFDAARQAERIFNASNVAVDIIRQNFDGGWGVTFDLSEPPWWLAGIFGQPSTANPVGNQYEHTYDFDNGNDPVPLRLYAPTDGFNSYYVTPGCWIVSVSIDQTDNESPSITLTGGYAKEPPEESSLSPTVPDFSQTTFSNRHFEVQTDGQAVGRAQNTNIELQTNTEGISELGSEEVVDFTPRTFEPSVTWDKIRYVGETVDAHQRFLDASQVTTKARWDNGETGDAMYVVEIDVTDSYPSQWSESGRNDPEEDLMEELQEMGQDATALVVSDDATPPGV